MGSGLHLMTVLPRRLACREYVSRQMIREVAERFENDEFRQHDDERNDPHDEDHATSSTWCRFEVERMTDGVIAFHRDDG